MPEASYGDLARTLQTRGFAVLTFDFRGHGGSVMVAAEFWKHPHNSLLMPKGVRGPRPGGKILIQEFPAAYHPQLVLDVAAAQRFLELRNDTRDLNANNLIVVGAGKGATLAALWLASEWHRVEKIGGPPAGSAVAAAVWISLEPNVFSRSVQGVDNWLHFAGQTNQVPMLFLHGQQDATAARTAGYVARSRPGNSPWTYAQPIPDTNAGSLALLRTKPAASEEVVKYIAAVLEQHPDKAWSEHDFEKKSFLWTFPGFVQVAKPEKTAHLNPLPFNAIGSIR